MTTHTTITDRQFSALMRVSGVGIGTMTHEALRMIFTEGKATRVAAESVGMKPATVGNAKSKVLNKYASLNCRIELLKDALGDGSLLMDKTK